MRSWAPPAYRLALQRLDLLLHREILRLRASYQLSLDEFRGLYISDRQVDELIGSVEHGAGLDVDHLSAEADRLGAVMHGELVRDPCWARLCESLELSAFERDVLLLAFATELHSKYPVIYAYLNNDVSRKHPTVELALNLFADVGGNDCRRSFAPAATLFARGLLVPLDERAGGAGLTSGFALSGALQRFLLGLVGDASPTAAASPEPVAYRDWTQWPVGEQVREQFRGFGEILGQAARPPLLVVEAAAESCAEALCANALAGTGKAAQRVDLAALARDEAQAQEQVVALQLTATLAGQGLLLCATELHESEVNTALLRRLLQTLRNSAAPVFLLVAPGSRWWAWVRGMPHIACELPPGSVVERTGMWQYHLARAGLRADETAVSAAADYFQLEFEQVRAAVDDLALRPENAGESALEQPQLFAAARRQSHGDMGALAERVQRNFDFADLVLPGAIVQRVHEMVQAIRARRRVFDEWGLQHKSGGASGLVALFSGASGTGKTMSASVIANAIGLDLFRVELSGIVSKYIGETEKNLDRIFAAARRANCILFFDEADALFGKRSEVKDAHDRYANIEVAYLLQKIENHDGIVILTTNLAKSIDSAFTRRMQFIVEFPRPDTALREQLWRSMCGESLPLAADVDFNFLARQFENTGGEIRNMVLDAALMAAANDAAEIDMALLVRSAARQMMKQGRVPSAVEFKHYFSLVDTRSA
ncbi:ATP-binding protein [Mangrovimicrobium sediminis]|uniref:ATP-binding protein n=1 Tax=Mangrovimicrobium sediminis TaxID=2562682 RepID=A0A4Z0M9H4_9GAMM|nr:ATP-binding protein [Haliea sp. SAOS-164]TGD76169.1 ATP-binding protein [Haliea sp. SAOS-164]